MFRALALRHSLCRRANAWNVSFVYLFTVEIWPLSSCLVSKFLLNSIQGCKKSSQVRDTLRLAREIQRQNYHLIYLSPLVKLTESTSAESSSSFKDNVVPLLPRGNWSGMLTLLGPLGRTLLSLSALLRWSAVCASWVLLRRRPRLKESQTNFKIRARNCHR